MNLLEGKKLNKNFRNRDKEIEALVDVSFSLQEGEILGVVGESGSGKSTLLKIISGLIGPDSGELFYKSKEYTGSKPKQAGEFLQYIFQNPKSSFDPRLTFEKSIVESGRKGIDRNRMLRIIDEVGLEKELLMRKPNELSGGQCQRMSIARALYSGVSILLCDEITSALDVSTQAQIISLLQKLRGKGELSLIFVSHDIALVRMLCDSVIVMKDGRSVECGKCEEVIKRPQHPYTKLLIESAIRQSIV